MSEYINIISIGRRPSYAHAFESKYEAIECIEKFLDILDFDVDDNESLKGEWKAELFDGTMLRIRLIPKGTGMIRYRIQKRDSQGFSETRQFTTRRKAIRFVEDQLEEAGTGTNYEESIFGEWSNNDLKFKLLTVLIKGDGLALYRKLAVDKSSNSDEIKRAYRVAAKKSHPDTSGSHDEMVQLTEARDTLLDPQKRREYDANSSIEEFGSLNIVSMVRNGEFIQKYGG